MNANGERQISRTEAGNYVSDDGDSVVREWDAETCDLVSSDRNPNTHA
ncbi:hypothetical protein [Rhodococcus sp. IEGM 1318]|nr:hypothetical protein [Rhodococcus sp. IEGM 1318]MDV8006782.1 hypothetical protein [Rhodococcus sp. IEGM 1318]